MRVSSTPQGWSRRRFVAGAASAAAALASTYGYMKWVEPGWLAVRRCEVPLFGSNGQPVRILQLSDFHASEEVSLELIGAAVREGLALKPDIICLTGDFITWRYDAVRQYTETLKPLSDAAPTYATLGNHDGGLWVGRAGYPNTDPVRRLLDEARITLLHNTSTEIQLRGRRLSLVGLGDLWAKELRGDLAFATVRNDSTTILLSHNPDSKEVLERHRWDLMLSGHTHGGQCDLVFFGTPFAPVQDRRYVRGLRRWQERWIHVTAGVGNLHGMRFNCRPEVNLLTLV